MPVFHDQSRADLRRLYFESWRKHRAGERLEPLEAGIAAVIAEHPEYHWLFEGSIRADLPLALEAEFLPEGGGENPFLHLGLHLALREQVATNRPPGITAIHAQLTRRLESVHQAEHEMFGVLGEMLWEAQRSGTLPDEARYLERLRELGTRSRGQ